MQGKAITAGHGSMKHVADTQATGIRQRVMMGQMRLLQGAALQQFTAAVSDQTYRTHAHRCTIAGIPFIERHLQGAFMQIGANPLAHRGPDVNRFGAHPGDKIIGNLLEIPAAGVDHGAPKSQGHLRIVGDLTGFNPEPATTDNAVVDPIAAADFSRYHEFSGCTQGVAQGQAEKRRAPT